MKERLFRGLTQYSTWAGVFIVLHAIVTKDAMSLSSGLGQIAAGLGLIAVDA